MKAQRVSATGEHEFEPVRGLPDRLPPGEQMLWQGTPDGRRLALQAFHLRKLAIYFGVMIAWRFIDVLASSGSGLQAAASLLWPVPLAAAGLGLLALLAWLSARTTVYTLTNKRVVMRLGIVLTVTFNLPLSRLEGAALRQRRDGGGDITLRLLPPQRIAYLNLWPHARPWALSRPEPMLRALPDAQAVAHLLADALSATLAQPGAAGTAPDGLPATAALRPMRMGRPAVA